MLYTNGYKAVNIRIGERIRSRRYYFRIVVVFILISFIPALILSLVYYRKASSVITQSIEDVHNQYLKQIAVSVDIVMDSIIHTAEQMATDNLYSEYVVLPNKNLYRSFRDFSTQTEVRRYYNYLELRRRIYNQLELRSATNDYIHSIYFYDRTDREVFPSDGVPHFSNEFPDREWLAVLHEDRILPYIMEPRTITDSATKQKKLVLSILYPVFEADGYFIFNVDIEYFHNSIFEKLPGDEKVRFFAFSQEFSRILFSPEEDALAGQLSVFLKQNGRLPGKEFFYMNTPWRINSYASPDFQWTYISMMTPDSYYGELKTLQINILLITGCILAGVACLIVIFGRYLYKPVQSLTDALAGDGVERPQNGGLGELGQVLRYVERTRDEKQALETRLRKNLPASRERVLYQLLEGLGGEDAAFDLESFGIRLEPAALQVMLLETGSGGNVHEGLTEDWLSETAAEVEAEWVLLDPCRGVYVFNPPKKDDPVFTAGINRILQRLKEDFGPSSAAGLSGICPSLSMLDEAFREADSSLRSRLVFGSEDVLQCSGKPEPGSSAAADLFDYQILQDALMQGQQVLVQEEIDSLMLQLQKSGRAVSLQTARHVYAEILSRILSVSAQYMGLNTGISRGSEDYYLKLLSLKDFHDVRNWLKGLAVEAAEMVCDSRRSKNSSYAEKAIAYLEREYGSQVNLNSLAERFGINPFYLSKMFKEETGINFTDYLTGLRIEKAKILLRDSEWTVKEVCTKVGYDSSNYFIRVFKKRTGQTPGEYQREFRLEKLYD